MDSEKLSAAIDNACNVLPSDCKILIDLSQGGGVVSLWVYGYQVEFPSTRETLADTIDDAVNYAQNLKG